MIEATREQLAGLRGRDWSDGTPWQDELEDFLRSELCERAFFEVDTVRRTEPRLLMFSTGDEGLIGIAGHRKNTVATPDGQEVTCHIELIAIPLEHRGTRIESGGRLSTHLMNAVMRDALYRHREERLVTAIAHRQNRAGLALCAERRFEVGTSVRPDHVLLSRPRRHPVARPGVRLS
jgi:hypothetical protein